MRLRRTGPIRRNAVADMNMCDRQAGEGIRMGSNRRRWVSVAAAGLLALAGCAGQQQYNRGKDLMASGQYDQAVEAFSRATAQSPGNTSYHVSLAQAQSLAADQHVKAAEQLVGEKRLSDAQRQLQTALAQMPGHPAGVPLAAKVDEQIRQCEDLIGKARAALDRQ